MGASITAELELLWVVFELVDDDDLDPELDREQEQGDRDLGDWDPEDWDRSRWSLRDMGFGRIRMGRRI